MIPIIQRPAEVQRLFDAFERWMVPVRYLANYALHHRRFPQASGASALIKGRDLVLRIPDAPEGPVQTALDLAYHEGRSVEGFSNEALRVVDGLIEALLTAFEQHAPDRLRRG